VHAALPLEQLRGFVECIGEASGGEYDDILRLCRLTRAERDERYDECGGKPSRDSASARYRDDAS
jgi:hypothetical protein